MYFVQPSKEEIKADNVPVKSSKTAPKERKGRTLTSTLTAQSEVKKNLVSFYGKLHPF